MFGHWAGHYSGQFGCGWFIGVVGLLGMGNVVVDLVVPSRLAWVLWWLIGSLDVGGIVGRKIRRII